MSNVTLTVGDFRLSGWKRGQVVSSLMTLADSFELSGFRFFGDEIPVKADDACILSIENEPIITGYIDAVKVSTNGDLVVMGRDKTRDLVDCQTLTTSFLNQTALSIVTGIAADFGIKVTGDSGPVIKQFVVSRDETAADAIVRILTNYGMIITSDKNGDVVVRNPGEFENPGFALKEGVNIQKAVGTFAGNKRFSSVNAFGQNYLSPGFSASAAGTSPRVRPKRLFLADEVNLSDCQLAAKRVRDYTDGSVIAVECTIQTPDYLPAGTALSFESEQLDINGEMLVETVSLEFDDDQSFVKFSLVSPKKYGGDDITSGFLL